MRNPFLVTVLFLVLALGLVLLGVARVSADVSASAGDVRAVFGILGMPIVVGLKQAGHRRLEFGWGSLVILAVPFLLGQLWALWRIRKRREALT